MPRDPVSMEASSERMSPKMLPVTMVSNHLGLRISCIAALSMYLRGAAGVGRTGAASVARCHSARERATGSARVPHADHLAPLPPLPPSLPPLPRSLPSLPPSPPSLPSPSLTCGTAPPRGSPPPPASPPPSTAATPPARCSSPRCERMGAAGDARSAVISNADRPLCLTSTPTRTPALLPPGGAPAEPLVALHRGVKCHARDALHLALRVHISVEAHALAAPLLNALAQRGGGQGRNSHRLSSTTAPKRAQAPDARKGGTVWCRWHPHACAHARTHPPTLGWPK